MHTELHHLLIPYRPSMFLSQLPLLTFYKLLILILFQFSCSVMLQLLEIPFLTQSIHPVH